MVSKTLAEAQSAGDVLGLKSTAGVVPRRDIDDLLLNEPNTFNLFLLALIDLKKDANRDSKMGFYQLAGIHGMPFMPWDKVQPAVATRKSAKAQVVDDWVGYCAHATPIFPTWHRPYLAMIEQSLYDRMAKIAESFEKDEHKQIYRTALKKFRLPYWDYYKPRGGQVSFVGVTNEETTTFPYDYRIPDIFTKDTIMIRTVETKNEPRPMPNPLKSFKFPPEESDTSIWVRRVRDRRGNTVDMQYWKPETSRYPGAGNDATSVKQLNEKLNQIREQDNEYCNNMILFPGKGGYDKFLNVVTTKFEVNGTAGSLEGLHNGYHNYIGNGGQMSDPAVAAFDPVFWIHHCQIDRIFAIWQASHPDEWYANMNKEPLYPFRYPQPSGGHLYWTPDDSQSTESFGYTYADADLSTAQAVKDNYKKRYDWAVRYQGRKAQGHEVKNLGTCPKEMLPPTAQEYANAQVYRPGPAPTTARVVQDNVATARKAAQEVVADTVKSVQPAPPPAAAQDTQEAAKTTHRVLSGQLYGDLTTPKEGDTDESNIERRWYIDNMVERLALNGTFTIYYFIGPFDNANESSWNLTPTLAGTSHNFAAPVEQCDNCGRQDQQGLLVTDTTPITPMLMDYVLKGNLEDLTPEKVEPFLVKNLRWRILKLGEGRVDPRVVRGLQIGINSTITPLDADSADIRVQEFPRIIDQIIGQSS